MPQKIRPLMEHLERREYFSTSTGVFVPPTTVFVAPLTTALDATHFHGFAAAYAASTAGGTITILNGAPAEATVFTLTKANLVIQGDASVSAAVLPRYTFTLGAAGITLAHLAVGDLIVASGVGHESVSNCDLQKVIISGNTATGGGFNHFDNNNIHGVVAVQGALGAIPAQDSFTHNILAHGITVSNDSGFIFTDNTVITGGVFLQYTSVGVTISRNVIANNDVIAGGPLGIAIYSNALTGVILDNVVSAYIGLSVSTIATNGVALRVEGNDFTGSTIGVHYIGLGNETAISVDLGGGSQGSLGGNDFRTFTGVNSNLALFLTQTSSTAPLFALNNIFKSGVALSKLAASQGPVQASALSVTQALIVNLFNSLLKRMPKAADYSYWGGVYTNSGQAAVVNGIERSAEALGRVVNDDYENFLGRAVDAAGLNYWGGQIQAGMSTAALQAAILGSAEFSGAHTTDWVQALYSAVLNRAASAGDLIFWTHERVTLGPAFVATAIVTSGENQSDQITAWFQRYLHRAASASDVANFLALKLDPLTLEARILSSPEYLTNG